MNACAALLDAASEDEARDALGRCCGASRWVRGMLASRPFENDARLFDRANTIWAEMDRADILEAFDHHPRIGADLAQLRKKFASTGTWAAGEQAGAARSSEDTLRALQQGNLSYEKRFGHIFIVCATGKSAEEMLALLEARMSNSETHELRVAAEEQRKITELRLAKLAGGPG